MCVFDLRYMSNYLNLLIWKFWNHFALFHLDNFLIMKFWRIESMRGRYNFCFEKNWLSLRIQLIIFARNLVGNSVNRLLTPFSFSTIECMNYTTWWFSFLLYNCLDGQLLPTFPFSNPSSWQSSRKISINSFFLLIRSYFIREKKYIFVLLI